MAPEFEAVSWRDPAGFIVRDGERVLRAVLPDAAVEVASLLNEPWFQQSVADGLIPRTAWIEPDSSMERVAPGCRWLEHQPVWFPAYPHEIIPEQLFRSARLTLDLADRALAAGWMLKDASAWNVLHGVNGACFVDVLSFERFDGSGVWAPYAQFCRHFIVPLLLYRDAGLEPHRGFLHSREGVSPESARRVVTGWGAMRQPALAAVTLPSLLGKFGRARSPQRVRRSAQPRDVSQYLLGRTLSRLRRQLDRVDPGRRRVATVWSDYEGRRSHYTDADLAVKRATVREMLDSMEGVRTVLDLGCNAGEFSFIAAEAGKRVVAVDADLGALATLDRTNRGRAVPVHPMVLDLGNPTPACGWLNIEVESFLVRAAGQFDCVMALGLLHHLLVQQRSTLEQVCRLFDTLACKFLILEWIGPHDPKFREIAAGNASLYENLDSALLEAVFSERYERIRRVDLPSGSRCLYAWRRRA